jgi:hypothetical protein
MLAIYIRKNRQNPTQAMMATNATVKNLTKDTPQTLHGHLSLLPKYI